MKISEKPRAIIEWVIAAVLIVICLKFSILSYGSFSPVKAHELSERTYHYGPSEVIKTLDLKGTKIYLCKYKDWFSADTVNRGIIKWYPGNQVGGTSIDYSKQVSYSWSGSSDKRNSFIMKFYGYVNDPDITSILLEDEKGTESLRYDLGSSRMFIFWWNGEPQKNDKKYVRGINKDGKVIYEEKAFY